MKYIFGACPYCGGPARCRACKRTCAEVGGLTEEGLCAGCAMGKNETVYLEERGAAKHTGLILSREVLGKCEYYISNSDDLFFECCQLTLETCPYQGDGEDECRGYEDWIGPLDNIKP